MLWILLGVDDLLDLGSLYCILHYFFKSSVLPSAFERAILDSPSPYLNQRYTYHTTIHTPSTHLPSHQNTAMLVLNTFTPPPHLPPGLK